MTLFTLRDMEVKHMPAVPHYQTWLDVFNHSACHTKSGKLSRNALAGILEKQTNNFHNNNVESKSTGISYGSRPECRGSKPTGNPVRH
jgi:hypothetical protein